MQATQHKITHQYQPTNTTCSPTALSMLLSAYDKTLSVDEISRSVPQVKNDKGENFGTINVQMATYCVELGFDVTLYTFDCQIIDQSWKSFTPGQIKERLEAGKEGWEPAGLGSLWSNAYRQAYIDFIDAGGKLFICSYPTSGLLFELLKNGPILPCLCWNTLYGIGRTVHFGETEEKHDDINGRAWNHSVVIYGNDKEGNLLIADPYRRPGLLTTEPEGMIAAISAAQTECDNLIFQITSKS